jgi:putative ABC transport system substrate-binding protein
MRRRDFIYVLRGAAAWPLAARAQQDDRVRRIGVLMLYAENDPQGELRAATFRHTLESLGWTQGRNVEIDVHWGVGDRYWIASAAAQLLKRAPDVIVANGPAIRPAQRATSTVPVIFIGVADPVADGFVQSLARPGGNLTGFTTLEPSVGAKLLELLKEAAPQVEQAAVLINADSPSAPRWFESMAAAAPKLAVGVVAVPLREPPDIEAAMMQLGSERARGVIVPPDPATNTHRRLIVELAARYRLPAVYALRAAAVEGGLVSYGVDIPDLFRKAAGYVDRVLRGEKPADLPVQQPTKFEFVLNLKTAKALGLTVPDKLLALADEVIE